MIIDIILMTKEKKQARRIQYTQARKSETREEERRSEKKREARNQKKSSKRYKMSRTSLTFVDYEASFVAQSSSLLFHDLYVVLLIVQLLRQTSYDSFHLVLILVFSES
jgi:hypothetical protein